MHGQACSANLLHAGAWIDWCAVAYTDKDRACHILAMQYRLFFLFKLAACTSRVYQCANHGIRQNKMSCSEANIAQTAWIQSELHTNVTVSHIDHDIVEKGTCHLA